MPLWKRMNNRKKKSRDIRKQKEENEVEWKEGKYTNEKQKWRERDTEIKGIVNSQFL
jgi:hypothetical protein